MDRDTVLAAIEQLVDKHAALVIKVGKLDNALGNALHENCMAWRELALQLGNIEIDDMERLQRHFDDKE